jgi:hypothetical protein
MSNRSKKEVIMNLCEEDDENSNNISEGSDEEYENSDCDDEKRIKTQFAENVIKYLKTDDIIKEKQKEHRIMMKNLKEKKKKSEDYILNYLEKMEETFVNIGTSSKLVKNKTETKSTIKVNNIKDGIIEGLKAGKIIENLNGDSEIIKKILDLIDSKRIVKTKTYLKRTSVGKKRGRKPKS